MPATVLLLAALLVLGVVLMTLKALHTKSDVKTTFKVPFLGSFSLEAKDRRPRESPQRRLRP